ncbi:histidine kinase dimerization/phosphoacceptor domain -containing protein [Mesorhizobium sp. VNQ89]|uniref:sensor histidine kinase n=1 Tax=Mesorhizobium quangtriensis TaxID=3157709 RepID=UPI0032B87DAA
MPTNVRTLVRSQILFIAVGVLALLAIVSAAFWLDDRSSVIASQILDARDLKSASVDLGALVQRAESSQRGFLYTENEIYLAPYDLAKEAALRDIDALPPRVEGYADLVAVTERLKQVITEKFAEMDESIRLTRSRERSSALDLVLTNRGKALMDEAMVYISGLSLAADRRLNSLVSEQTANTLWQRLVSIVGATVVAAAAFAALFTIIRYARELSRAHKMLSAANTQLETKVANRTADLAKSTEEMRAAKDRAESLMLEVNHRVANSLAIVSSLIGLQANSSGDASTKTALTETQSRIQAVALVHQRLYRSDNVTEVALDDYLRSLLDQFQTTMGDDKRISLSYHLEPISLRTDATINLGVIASEWVMNAAKYAYPERAGPVRVNLTRGAEGDALLSVEDDGVGRGTGPAQGTGLGSRIVKAMATALRGRVEYVDRNPGLSARLAFPLSA